MTVTTRKATPNRTPWRPNASGTAKRGDEHRRHRNQHRRPHRSRPGVDRVRQPGVGRPRPPEHARISRPCPTPLHVGLSDSTVVTCVKPKTNTRSKKSSSGVTAARARRLARPQTDGNAITIPGGDRQHRAPLGPGFVRAQLCLGRSAGMRCGRRGHGAPPSAVARTAVSNLRG